MTANNSKHSPNTKSPLARSLQAVLDEFYYLRAWIVILATYLSIRLFGVERSLSDIKQWTLGPTKPSSPMQSSRTLVFDEAKALDVLLAEAQHAHKSAEARRLLISDRSKTLLTLCSLLLAFAGLVMPDAFVFDNAWMQVMFFCATVALLNAVMLLLVFFGVGTDTAVHLSQKDVKLSETELKKSLLGQYMQSQAAVDGRTNYLVDVYRAARFYFLSAFTVLLVVFSVHYFARSPRDTAEPIVHKVRSDAELIELLRGSQGPSGNTEAVDPSAIADQLMEDPRILEAIRREVNEAVGAQGASDNPEHGLNNPGTEP